MMQRAGVKTQSGPGFWAFLLCAFTQQLLRQHPGKLHQCHRGSLGQGKSGVWPLWHGTVLKPLVDNPLIRYTACDELLGGKLFISRQKGALREFND